MKTSSTNNRFEKLLSKNKKYLIVIQNVWNTVLLSIVLLLIIELLSYFLLLIINSQNKWHYDTTPDIAIEKYIQETDMIDYEYYPYIEFRRKSNFKGKYVNIDNNSVRSTYNPCKNLSNLKIFMFGGSTMWGTGSRDNYTISSHLSKLLCNENIPVEVINFGESGYTNSQEMIKLILELRNGNIPDIVVFYDGVNDIYSAYQNNMAGYPQNLNDRQVEFGLRIRFNILYPIIENTNSGKIIQRIQKHFSIGNKFSNKISKNLNKEIVDIYSRNLKVIQTLAECYNIKVYYFWQPTIFTKEYHSDSEKEIERKEKQEMKELFLNTYDYLRKYNGMPRNFFNLDSCFNNKYESFYIDFCHVSEKANELIALEIKKIILPEIIDK